MLSTTRAIPDQAPPPDLVDRTAIIYLMLPLGIFLVGWFEWWVALPLIACAMYALKPTFAGNGAEARRAPLTPLQVIVAIVVGSSWAVLGGADHILFANADWHIRDAVLHDLVLSPWPVGYGAHGGSESLLRAPVAFYLPAALIGKWAGLGAAHVAMGIWTALGATLFLVQVLSLTGSRVGVAVTTASVVVLFSGLDIIGSLLNEGPHFRIDWNITTHLEWWAGKFQYSSMTTQLFWVPNHALGAWVSIGLLCRNKNSDTINSLLPIVVVALALWSPLSAIGFVPFVVLRVAVTSMQTRSLHLFHPLAWAPAALVGSVIAAYFLLDPAGIPKGVSVGGDGSAVLDLLEQAQFFFLEAGLIGGAIFALRRSTEVALALVILAFLPLVHLGPANDLVMRASIPSLAVLTIGAALALVGQGSESTTMMRKLPLVALLLVGAVTPIEEIARAVLLPAWPVNMSATLIGANCGGFAPHYEARLGNELIGRLMRPVHPLPIGPQGRSECNNPAFELMWSWGAPPRKNLHPLVSVQDRSGKF